jgi:subfamily B ATP-binding cassette protein MsbA
MPLGAGKLKMPYSKGFVRSQLRLYPGTTACLAMLTILSVIPALALVIILAQAIRQLQSEAQSIEWSSLVGEHAARWLLPIVRGTSFEQGVSAELQLALLPIGLATAGLLHALIKGSVEFLAERMSEDAAQNTWNNLLEAFFAQPYSSGTRTDGSHLATLVGTDVREVKLGIRRLVGLMPMNALQSIVLLAWLIALDTKLFALFLAVLVPAAIVIRVLAKTLKRLAREGLDLQSEIMALFVERIRGWETIRVFQSLSNELDHFRERNLQLFKRLRRTARASGLGAPTVEWLATIAGAMVVLIALRRLAIGELSSSVLTGFLVTLGHLSGTLQGLTRHIAGLRRTRAAIDRISEFIAASKHAASERMEHVALGNIQNPLKGGGTFEFESVELEGLTVQGSNFTTFSSAVGGQQAQDVRAAKINMTLRKGDFCVIVGPSGSGKSTLLRCLVGLEPPRTGRVLINGHELNESIWKSYSSDLSFIEQDPFLSHGSLLENIIFPKRFGSAPEIKAIEAEVEQCLSRAGLPKAPGTFAGELSGGEKQRLMLARAFFRRTTLWILDESTSALDPANEERFLQSLKGAAADHIIVFVTHRTSVTHYATKWIKFES